MALTPGVRSYDMVIIGAGISGIAMARFYLEIHPDCQLLLIERDSCVGGTFSEARSYSHFWTQYAYPYGHFSDMPMEKPPEKDLYYGFFPAKYTSDYLEQYVDNHDFAGQSIRDRIRFNNEVMSVTKLEDGSWHILGHDLRIGNRLEIYATKLVIASGSTSVPKMPVLVGEEIFKAPIVHTLDFARSRTLSHDNGVEHVTVLGGGKSAGDMAYSAAKAGKTVSWIVRPGGHGPSFYAPVNGAGPYKGTFDLGSARVAQILGPSIWGWNNWFLRWLHESQSGANLISKVFAGVDEKMIDLANFKERTAKGDFDKLKFHTGIFWTNGPGGLLNREDFWDTIASKVEVHYDVISHLTEKKVHLQNGNVIDSDVLLCGTGWQYSFHYFADHLAAEQGLPYPSAACPEQTKQWADLDIQADKNIATRFPILANPPPHFHTKPDMEPYRLYNTIAPAHATDPTLVVIGQALVTNYFRVVECQSIWATAYLDGHINLPPLVERMSDIAKTVAWSRRRYLSTGDPGNNFTFYTHQYCDKLLADLGLTSHRTWWFPDLFYPRTPEDLRGLKDEFRQKFLGIGNEKETVAAKEKSA